MLKLLMQLNGSVVKFPSIGSLKPQKWKHSLIVICTRNVSISEALRRNEKQKKRDDDKENPLLQKNPLSQTNPLSQKNELCICLQDKVYGQCIFEEQGSDVGLSSHLNKKYCAPASASNESSVSRKATCIPCSVLSEDFDAQGSKLKKKVQDGITLPRNPALESYLRRNTPTKVNTSNSSLLLSLLSVESNELYETALSSFHEFEADSFEQQSLGFVNNTFQHDVPVGFNFDDCKLSLNGNLQLACYDHTSYNSLGTEYLCLFVPVGLLMIVVHFRLCCHAGFGSHIIDHYLRFFYNQVAF